MNHLIEASALLNGSYNNGRGARRPGYIHKVLEKDLKMEEGGELITVPELSGKLVTALAVMKDPSEELKTDIQEAYSKVKFDGRWGYRGQRIIATQALGESGLSELFVSRLALSEVDAEWVHTVELEEVIQSADIILAARGIASHYHSLELWAFNSD